MTETFPTAEMFGLTSQPRCAAVSIAAHIAEGYKKQGKSDKARFLNIAQGSAEEGRYYLILIRDVKYANPSRVAALPEEVNRLLEA